MTDAFFTCGTESTGAADQVQDQFAKVNAKTDLLLNKTLEAVADLAALQAPAVTTDLPPVQVFNYNIEPYVPNPNQLDPVDLSALDKQLPDEPVDGAALAQLDVGEAPLAPPDAPNPIFAQQPGVYHPSFAPTPQIVNPNAPVMSDLTGAVIAPTPRAITLPVAPDVNVGAIQFLGVAPKFSGVAPDPKDFNYVEQDYQQKITMYVQPAIQAMLQGQSGLPAAIESAIWAREAQREDETAMAAEQEAMDAWAGRGHGLVGGALNRQIQMTRQNSQNQKNSLGRDVAIEAKKTLIEQLKFGVAQGLAYEDLFIRLFNDVQNRKLQAARFAVDISIAVYNALVAQYQAEAAVFKTFADVYLAQIQGELAKLQVYSEQLRAAEIIGNLNEQDIRIYTARLSAIKVNIEAYATAVQAYSAQINANTQIIDQAKLLIEEEKAKLEASDIEVRAWLGGIQGQQLMQQAYGTRAQVYMTSMQGFSTKNQINVERLKVDIANKEETTKRYEALLAAFGQLTNYARAKGELTIQNNQVKLQSYQADVAGKSAYNTALVQKMQNIMQDLIAAKELSLKQAEVNMQNLLEVHRIIETKMSTVAQVLSSMTSAFGSATHVGAQVSDSNATGTECSFNTSQTIGG